MFSADQFSFVSHTKMFQFQISAAVFFVVVMAAHARNIVDGNSWNELDLGSNENEGDDLSKWRMLEKREPTCENESVTRDLGKNAIPRYVTEVRCAAIQPEMLQLRCSPNACRTHYEELRYVTYQDKACTKPQTVPIGRSCKISPSSVCYVR